MRISVEYISGGREVYKKFCEVHPTIIISYKAWKEIIYLFNRKFRKHILETGEKLKMPWGMGNFSISKKKVAKFKEHNGKTYVNLPIDWKKTRAAGKRIYNFNSHTDGYRCKWYWFMKEARFYLSDVWIFKPSRESSREIAKYINNKEHNYIDYYQQWAKGY